MHTHARTGVCVRLRAQCVCACPVRARVCVGLRGLTVPIGEMHSCIAIKGCDEGAMHVRTAHTRSPSSDPLIVLPIGDIQRMHARAGGPKAPRPPPIQNLAYAPQPAN